VGVRARERRRRGRPRASCASPLPPALGRPAQRAATNASPGLMPACGAERRAEEAARLDDVDFAKQITQRWTLARHSLVRPCPPRWRTFRCDMSSRSQEAPAPTPALSSTARHNSARPSSSARPSTRPPGHFWPSVGTATASKSPPATCSRTRFPHTKTSSADQGPRRSITRGRGSDAWFAPGRRGSRCRGRRSARLPRRGCAAAGPAAAARRR